MVARRFASEKSTGMYEMALKEVSTSVASLLSVTNTTADQFLIALRHQVVLLESKKYPSGKENKSRIAFTTGISRADVARFLKNDVKAPASPTQMLVAMWRSDPRFTDHTGLPLTLPIFGNRRSFEHLVRLSGKGIPLRAVLDELVEGHIATLMSGQRLQLHAASSGDLALSRMRGIERLLRELSTAVQEFQLRNIGEDTDLRQYSRRNLKRSTS